MTLREAAEMPTPYCLHDTQPTIWHKRGKVSDRCMRNAGDNGQNQNRDNQRDYNRLDTRSYMQAYNIHHKDSEKKQSSSRIYLRLTPVQQDGNVVGPCNTQNRCANRDRQEKEPAYHVSETISVRCPYKCRDST